MKNNDDLDALMALAEKATPGPWLAGYWSSRCILPHPEDRGAHGRGRCAYNQHSFHSDDDHTISSASPNADSISGTCNYEEGGIRRREDRDFIAACDPARVKALIERVRRANDAHAREIERAEKWKRVASDAALVFDPEHATAWHDSYDKAANADATALSTDPIAEGEKNDAES